MNMERMQTGDVSKPTRGEASILGVDKSAEEYARDYEQSMAKQTKIIKSSQQFINDALAGGLKEGLESAALHATISRERAKITAAEGEMKRIMDENRKRITQHLS